MKIPRVVGWVVVCLVAGLMVLAAVGKLSGTAPEEVTAGLQQVGLSEEIQLIGIGAVVTAVLLVIPFTASLGVLLASAYWGGAIVTHMAQGESYVVPAVLLGATWVGVGLRNPRLLWSFTPRPTKRG